MRHSAPVALVWGEVEGLAFAGRVPELNLASRRPGHDSSVLPRDTNPGSDTPVTRNPDRDKLRPEPSHRVGSGASCPSSGPLTCGGTRNRDEGRLTILSGSSHSAEPTRPAQAI